jgi:TrmH family RNA methyltransferase
MISKAQVKHIQSLQDKKYRIEHQQFLVEGHKMVRELLCSSFSIVEIVCLPEWFDEHQQLLKNVSFQLVREDVLQRCSNLKTANQVLAIVNLPNPSFQVHCPALLLDDIQDPGNVGSIIRIADWYAIPAIYYSAATADPYSAKVVQATMGSVFRVQLIEANLHDLLLSNKSIVSYAAVLGGTAMSSLPKVKESFILLGNESQGIHPSLSSLCTHALTIPKRGSAESLNVAVASGIICHSLLF